MEHSPFGVFNPRFYGTTIFLSDAARQDTMFSYAETNDVQGWTRARAQMALSDHVMVSAMDHETRHFHDFLLSPLGTVSMGMRISASLNGFQAMKVLKHCEGKVVPVPLSRWIGWDEEARQRWIETDGQFFGVTQLEDVVTLPHRAEFGRTGWKAGANELAATSAEQELALYVEGALKAYETMDRLRRERVDVYELKVCADDVFEASAHLIQVQAAWTGQGEAAAESVYRFIHTSMADHLRPLQVLWRILDQGEQKVSIQRLTELFTWMMLGAWEQLRGNGHPGRRYTQVLEFAAALPDHDLFRGEMSAEELFDLLDAATASSSWRDNLGSAMAAADRRLASYREMGRTKLKGGYFDALFAVAEAWHRDQAALRKLFLRRPEVMTTPLEYVGAGAGMLPKPLLEYRFGAMAEEREQPLKSETVRAITIDAEGRRVVSYIGAARGEKTDVLDSVVGTRILTHMVDFLFEGESQFDAFEGWCRSVTERMIGKTIVSVY